MDGDLIVILRRAAFAILLGTFLPTAADAQEDIGFLDIRLMATDLIDEMVYSWSNRPPVEMDGAYLTLTSLTAPVGLNQSFNDMVENRLYELLVKFKAVPLRMVHCGICSQWIAKSTPKKTFLSRGIDQPEVLEEIFKENENTFGLDLNFEAVGKELVLRATVFEVRPPQKIVWAERFSTSRSSRRVLRTGDPLISLDQARKEQRLLFEERGRPELVTRFSIRNFNGGTAAVSGDGVPQIPIPLFFLEQSFESAILPDRAIRGAMTLGFMSIKDTMQGWSAGGHFSSLLLRDKPSIANPDLYFLMGFHYVRFRGPAALPFGGEQLQIDRLLDERKEPKASIVSLRMGFELFAKNSMGFGVFVENVPVLRNSHVFEENDVLGVLPFHNWGMNMVMRW